MTRTILLLLSLLCAAATLQAQTTALEMIRAYFPVSENLATSGQPTDEQFQDIRDAGFEVVINLAPPVDMHASEGFLVTSTGMAYVQIPVDFKDPQLDHLELFFRVMEASKGRKVWVHCFANFRVSSFVYLYRTLHEGLSEEEARKDLQSVWEPDGAWPGFIQQAQAYYSRID